MLLHFLLVIVDSRCRDPIQGNAAEMEIGMVQKHDVVRKLYNSYRSTANYVEPCSFVSVETNVTPL